MDLDRSWPAVPGIAYGGDYTPEQWPREVWDEDVALMSQAGVTIVSVGIFAWALIETSEAVFDFEWLDDLLDLMHRNGIAVDLGTPTASPPAWFFAAHPDAHATTADGTVMGFGARGMASPSSPAYREAVVRIATALAERYAKHPAVVMWHVHNEYGVPVAEDHSPQSTSAFRAWLQDRYTTIDALNTAWGTAFWGQHYTTFEHINTPTVAPSVVNPSQRLDFARFTDSQLRACFIAERDAIRAHADQPITTNFMANQHWGVNMWAWADEVDIMSDDHYLWAEDPEAEIGLSMAADLTRCVGGGKPWILMEHSTSAVNWQPRNLAKRPLEMARNSLAHVARGADAVMFFQWRATRHGAEKFHSAMLPHAGTRTRVWREVVELGADLDNLAEVRGSRVQADVAILWDFESFWAQDLEWRPSVDVAHKERVRSFYERMWRDGITVDFVLPGHDLSGYKLVVAPAQYMLSTADAENLTTWVEQGGVLLVSFFSGIVDEHDAVHEGGYMAPFQDVLGVLVEEFLPMREGARSDVAWMNGDGAPLSCDIWQEDLRVSTAEVKATYLSGPGVGGPAITRNNLGSGVGWYISTRLNEASLEHVMASVYHDAGVASPRHPEGVEIVTREGADNDYTFAINHTPEPVVLDLTGHDLTKDLAVSQALHLAAGDVAVVRTPRPATTQAPQ